MTFDEDLVVRGADIYADFLMPHLRPDSRVLDVGCGSGTITIGLAAMVAHVTGIDADPGEYTAAEQYIAARDIANVQFRAGDITALGPADSFDACLCHLVLQAIEDPHADPYLGRALRGLVDAAGFEDVVATTRCISYWDSGGRAVLRPGPGRGVSRRVVCGPRVVPGDRSQACWLSLLPDVERSSGVVCAHVLLPCG